MKTPTMMMMTKALLLALAVGVACTVDPAQVSGPWRTVAIASDSPGLTADGGPLRALLRRLQCYRGCRELTVSFYTRQYGACIPHMVVAWTDEDGVYVADFEGRNYFRVLEPGDGRLVFVVLNVGIDGSTTHLALAAAREQQLSDEYLEQFSLMAEENGIPRENVERVAGTDSCVQ